MIPDKIYIAQATFPDRIDWDGSPINTKRIEKTDEEYIRKGALLEWLNGEVERYNDKLIQPSNNKEKAIQIASSISSLLVVIAKIETL